MVQFAAQPNTPHFGCFDIKEELNTFTAYKPGFDGQKKSHRCENGSYCNSFVQLAVSSSREKAE